MLGKSDFVHQPHQVSHHPMTPIGEPNVRQHLTEVSAAFLNMLNNCVNKFCLICMQFLSSVDIVYFVLWELEI